LVQGGWQFQEFKAGPEHFPAMHFPAVTFSGPDISRLNGNRRVARHDEARGDSFSP
jgi:hypothetical protein